MRLQDVVHDHMTFNTLQIAIAAANQIHLQMRLDDVTVNGKLALKLLRTDDAAVATERQKSHTLMDISQFLSLFFFCSFSHLISHLSLSLSVSLSLQTVFITKMF